MDTRAAQLETLRNNSAIKKASCQRLHLLHKTMMITRLDYIQLIALYMYSVLGMSESMTVFKGVKQSVLEDIYIQDPHHMLASLTTDSHLFCMQYCINSQACMSFSYNTDANSCVLFDVVYGSTEKGYPLINTRHYNIGDSEKCPPGDGYLHFREINGCYKPQPDQSGDYSDAADVCEKEGAYLVKFNNLNEKNSIRNMLLASNYYDTSYWTGAHQDGPGNSWMWRDGTAVDPLSDTFRPGEPSGSGPCGYWDLNANGLNDMSCPSWPRILCEKDISQPNQPNVYVK